MDTRKRPVQGVGQTERQISRANRLKQEKKASSNPAFGDGANKVPPKLDESGRLMPEEVVRRSQSSITTKTMILGTPEHEIRVDVSVAIVSFIIVVVVGTKSDVASLLTTALTYFHAIAPHHLSNFEMNQQSLCESWNPHNQQYHSTHIGHNEDTTPTTLIRKIKMNFP